MNSKGGLNDLNDTSGSNPAARFYGAYNQQVQRILDKVTPFLIGRWAFCGLMFLYFMYRVIVLQGFYIIAYVLGIFLLNQFILFLTPVFVEDMEMDDDEPSLPTKSDEEFRPFMRRLPEFKFWYTTYKSLLISIVCTFFDVFDIPVFWPILVMYFITLFVVTMKRQIRHMIKHRYLPFSYGKIKYQGKNSDNSKSSTATNVKFNTK